MRENQKKAVTMTAEEQELLLEKVSSYAKREPEISAHAMDFSKPVDDEVN